MANPELAVLRPNSEILWCPVCGDVVHQHTMEPFTAKMSIPSRGGDYNTAIMLMMQATNELYEEKLAVAEVAARTHFEKKHRIRFWLWERYGWNRILRRWLV